MPILLILVESASLQLVVELILLILYSINYNAQYILLEIVTPLVVRLPRPCALCDSFSDYFLPFAFFFISPVDPAMIQGITFTAITIRITLRMSGALDGNRKPSHFSSSRGHATDHHVATIGSMPSNHARIAVNIAREIETTKDQETTAFGDYKLDNLSADRERRGSKLDNSERSSSYSDNHAV